MIQVALFCHLFCVFCFLVLLVLSSELAFGLLSKHVNKQKNN
jgi:hypothetical protein